MSKSAKTGIIIVIIIIVLVVLWLTLGKKGTTTPAPTPSDQASASVSPSPVANAADSQAAAYASLGLTGPDKSSTSDIQSDAAAIDNEMQGLSTDSANVDQGISVTNQ
jgi:hypothetical protein